MGTQFYLNTTAPVLVPTWPLKNPVLPEAQHQNAAGSSVEQSLGTVVATPLTTLSLTSLANTNPQSYFFGRFTSPPLAAQTIASQIWWMYVSGSSGSTASGVGSWHTLYIYRPSTGGVQFIIPGTSQPRIWYAGGGTVTTENRLTGAAVTVLDGDVLVYEHWARGVQTMASAYPISTTVNDGQTPSSSGGSRIECPGVTFQFYTGPTGTNYPSVADTLALSPLAVADATDIVTRYSNAVATTYAPMTAFNATSLVNRAPIFSTADPTTYAHAATAATAVIAKTYASIALPFTFSPTTPNATTDVVQAFENAIATTYAPMTAFNATSTAQLFSNANTNVYAPMLPFAATSSATFGLVESLQENFDGVLDTNKWTVVTTNGTLDFSGGTSVHNITTAANGNQAVAISTRNYSLIGSAIFIKLVQPIKTTANANGIDTGFGVILPGTGNRMMWRLSSNGLLVAHIQSNWVVTTYFTEPAYIANAANYAWFRISERGGTAYWETAPATASNPPIETDWVSRATIATASLPGSPATSQIVFHAYMELATAGIPTQPLKFDGLNTAASVVAQQVSSIADPFTFTPTEANASTDAVQAFDNAVALTFTPLAAIAATSTAQRFSVANSLTYAHIAYAENVSLASRAGVAVYAHTATAATAVVIRQVQSQATSISYTFIAPDATAVVAKVYTSTALPTTYAHAASVTTDVLQAFSVALPIVLGPVAALAATSTAAITSGANPGVYATTPNDATSSVNASSVASPSSYLTVPSSIDLFFSGIVNLYCVADPSNIAVTAGTKANVAYLPRAQNNVAAGSAVDGVLSSFWGGAANVTNRTVSTLANTNPQSHYFGRFVSRPLAGQTIPPQTWNYAAMVGETALTAKTFFAPVMYVWRPSNNTVVGYIFDGSVVGSTEWPTAVGTATRNINGASVAVQDGDVLVVEAWGVSNQTSGVVNLQTWRITDNTSKIVSQYKLFYLPTSTLWFTSNAATASPTAGKKATNLPLAVTGSATTIATEYLWSEVAPNDTNQISRTVNAQSTTASPQSYYLARFSTPSLAAQTIPAQTWSYEISCGVASVNSHTFFWPVIYAWRPSTNQVVGYVFNASGPAGVEWRLNDDPRLDQQFAGASLSVLDGDILVIEVWGAGQETTTAGTYLQRMWTNSFNSRVVSPYKIVYYTGLKQTVTSDATQTTYAYAANDATSAYVRAIIDVPSTALPAVYAHAPVATIDVVSVQSQALPSAYAYTPTVATSSVARAASVATATTYALAPVAAVSSYVPTAGNALPATYTVAPAVAQAYLQLSSAALPLVYAFAGTVTAAGRSFTSAGNAGLYALAAGLGSGSIGRVVNAQPEAFSQAAFATGEVASAYSSADPASYAYSPAAATVYLGRVYTSVATATGYAITPVATSEVVLSFSIASPIAYSTVATSTTEAIASQSIATPTAYSQSAQAATVSLGRVYTSVASPTSFFFAPDVSTGEVFARVSNATPAAYSATFAPATDSALAVVVSNATPAAYSVAASNATVYLGRIYSSFAQATSFYFNPLDVGFALGRASNATPTAYNVAGNVAQSGANRNTIALPTAYNVAAQDVFAGFVRVVPSNAASAIYSQQPIDIVDGTIRASTALPATFSGTVGTTTGSSFARVSAALPALYTLAAQNATGIAGRAYSSAALQATYTFSPGYPGDAVSDFTIALGTTYSAAAVAATANYSKNSLAAQTGYATAPMDAWSGRVIFSIAVPAAFTVISPTAISYVPVKQASIALPPTFLVTATATNTRRVYATRADRAVYVQARFDTGDIATSQVKPPIVFPPYVPQAVLTDAQFTTWLNNERAKRITLIETSCVDPVTGSTELVYFASSGFVTKLEDGPPNYYAPLLRGGLAFAQTIDLDLSGNQSYGDIELDNTSGELDWMFDRVWLFKGFKAFIGDATWPRRDYRQIFDGNIEDVDSSQRDTVNIRLRDKLYRLESPLHDVMISGTDTTNADRLIPVTLGECHNVTPLLKDATQLIYTYHARVTEGVIEVRDNGIPVNYTFLAGSPASFKLVKQPYGRITCSVQGDWTPAGPESGYVNTVAAIVKRLVMEWGTVVANRFKRSDIDMDNFSAFDINNKAPVGLYQTERLTVREACQEVAASVGARMTMTALGKAQLVRLRLPPPNPGLVNLQVNGDFSQGMTGWIYGGSVGGVAPSVNVGINLDASWYIPGGFTFYANQIGTQNNAAGYFIYVGKATPAEPNKLYTVSAYTGAHRCKVDIVFYEYDANGTIISVSSPSNVNNAEASGGTTLSGYKLVTASKVTLPGVVTIRAALRKWDTIPGNSDSWLFATNVTITSEGSDIKAPIVVTESDMVLGSMHIADRLPVVAGARLGYCKNWTVQEDTAAGVPEDHKAMYARDWLTVPSTNQATRDRYGLSGEPEQENCLLLDKVNATNECARRVDLRSAQRHVYEFIGFANLMFTPVGAAMTVIHRRFNLTAGKTGQVVSVAVDWLTSQVTIKVLI